jgi:hypothetical protein
MRQYRYDDAGMGTPSRILVGVAAVALLVSGLGCHRADTTPPVATLTVSSAHARVPVASPLALTFKFDVAPGASIAGDYKVFVHVTAASDGQLLWTDDHEPAVPTSQWKPGQTVQYTRTRFVPPVPHPGDIIIEAGLYRDAERLPLQVAEATSRDQAARGYKVATLQLAPESENIFLIYKSGWHPEEFSSADAARSWRWTQKTAVLAFKNPRADASLLLEFDARPDIFPGHPQQVSVAINNAVLASFAADSAEAVTRRVAIPAAALGSADMAELRIDADRTFVPAELPAGGKDTRELGIRVYRAFVESR